MMTCMRHGCGMRPWCFLSDILTKSFTFIELLISSYFNIVKRTVIDTVPKAIMLNLVNNAKEELQRELLQELYKTEVLDELLKESEYTQNRRKDCKKMIEALQKADEIVGSGKLPLPRLLY